jgi:ketosteroid isomerase-like protein
METNSIAEVLKANILFYEAFESLNIEKMERLWLHEDYVQCFHPGWGLLRGWDSVMTSWKRIFENTPEMAFRLTDVHVEVRDQIAVVTLYENLTTKVGAQAISGVVLATNVFERRPAGWLVIHHHGSPVMNPPPVPSAPTVH